MVGKRMRKLRREMGLTQGELGRRLGVSASTVGMYEQGRRSLGGAMLKRVAEVFEVSVDYLLRQSGDSKAVELDDLMPDVRKLLKEQEGLMFHGVPLGPEDVEKLVDAMRLGAAIIMQKQKN